MMNMFKKNNNPEKIKLEEMKRVYLLANPNNKTIYKSVMDWNEALGIMGKSEFKEDYAPEDAKYEINKKIYQTLKEKSTNGSLKSSLDILLNKGEDGYGPLIKMLPSSLPVDEVYLYCFNEEVNPYVEKINKIVGYMKDAIEKREFELRALFDFDAAVDSIDKLVADFKYEAIVENEPETYRIASNFGINLLTKIISLEAEELSKDKSINIYTNARELIKKYAKKSNMETDKEILKLDRQFNKKIKSFKEWALKHQDELYNAAIEKAEDLDRSYEPLKDRFVDFSLTYSVILEEDRQSIQNALEKIDKTHSYAYATANEITKANFWETQNTKNDKQ